MSSPLLRGLSGGLGGRSGLTASDRALLPYVRKEEEEAKKVKFQPLRMLFDILSRPQYVTANIAEEVTRSIQAGEPLSQATADVVKGIWEGITGKRKGDWETILFGGQTKGGEDFSGWFPGAGEQLSHPLIGRKVDANGRETGFFRPRKWIGTAANIIMDPTTWIGIGPAKAARASAAQFAEDAAKVAAKNPELGAKIVSAVDPNLGKNVQKLLNRLKQGTSYNAERYVTDVAKEAQKAALSIPGDELRKRLGGDLTKYMGGMAPESWQRTAGGLSDLMERLANPNAYGGAGKRTLSVFGRDVMEVPQGPLSKGWETLKTSIKQTPGGQKFGDAMWAVMEKGPLGSLRRLFGFRNPYQKIVHAKKRDGEILGDRLNLVKQSQVDQLLKGVDDEDLRALRDATDKAYALGKEGQEVNAFDIINRPELHGLEIAPEKRKALADLSVKIKQMTDQWWNELQPYVAEGSINPVGFVDNYIPTRSEMESMYYAGKGMGSKAPGFSKKKTMSLAQHREEAIASADAVFGDVLRKAAEQQGVDYRTFMDNFIDRMGFADVDMDYRSMLMHRAAAQANAIKRGEMVRDFKEFGFPVQEAQGVAAAAPEIAGVPWVSQGKRLEGPPGSVQQPIGQPQMDSILYYAQKLGLRQADDPAFAGYLFDDEVADIINKLYVVNNNRDAKNGLATAFKWWTQWWKGIVTLTPGFHVRNWMSNEMTGFIKNGMKNFDPSLMKPVAVGSAYAMNPQKWTDMLTGEMKIPRPTAVMELNKTFAGDKTLRELSDFAADKGVIGFTSQGFDLPANMSFGRKLNEAVGTENPVFRLSKKVGSVIENTTKFKDFLINFRDAVQGGSTADEAMEWAAAQTKKWFLDYGDLTDFEKNVMRNLIPFYSWIRKNTANQLAGIMLYPSAYNIIGKVQAGATQDDGLDYSLVPEYYEQQGMFPVGTDPETGYPVMFRPDFPFKDINMLPFVFQEGDLLPTLSTQELVNDVIGAAHPLIKTIMAVAPERGWNFFKRTDIKKQETAPAVFQYFAKSPKVLGFLDGAMRLAGYENGIKVDMTRDNNRVLMDGKAVAIIENYMPSLRSIASILETAEEGVKTVTGLKETVEDWVDQTTGKRDYYEGLEDLLQRLAKLGIKFKVMNTDYLGDVRARTILAKAQAARTADQYGTPGAQQRRAAYQRSRDAQLRRLGL